MHAKFEGDSLINVDFTANFPRASSVPLTPPLTTSVREKIRLRTTDRMPQMEIVIIMATVEWVSADVKSFGD